MKYLKLLFVLIISLGLVSCLEDEDDEQKAYDESTQVTLDIILQGHIEIFDHVNFFDKRPGEYVYYKMNTKANTQTQAKTIGHFESSFNALCETDHEFKFSLSYSFDYTFDEEEPIVKDYIINIPKSTGASSQKLNTLSKMKLNMLRDTATKLNLMNFDPSSTQPLDPNCDPAVAPFCLKFYEYELKTYQKKAPQEIQDAGCPGLTDCNFNVTKQTYKQVVQVDGEPEQVILRETELAPEVPYFDVTLDDFLFQNPEIGPIYNGILSHCRSTWVTTEDGRAYVKQCTFLRNMSQGEGEELCPAASN